MRQSIREAGVADIPVIQTLIFEIFPATYESILRRAQIDFMLEKSYSDNGLRESMSAGQRFYLLYDDSGAKALGFIALQNKRDDILRIEKLYLLPSVQGKGLGQQLIAFAADEAQGRARRLLELNVNRNNPAYHFYLKQGFQVVEEVDIPYYGFVLDDYVMQKPVDFQSITTG